MLDQIKPKIRPTIKQDEAYQKLWDDIIIYLIFGGGAGGGKSWLGCEWLLTNCYEYPESRWFIGRKELSRLMKSSYITFLKVCKFHQIPRSDWKLNGQYNYIEFIDGRAKGSRIDLLDLDYKPSDPDYDRFGSLEYSGGWVEEAGEVKFGAFDVLKSRVGRHLNKELNIAPKILITCNPSKNWLYKIIYKPYREKTLPKEYAFIQSLYGDNPHTAEIYQQQLAQITDKATKQRLMFGNWEFESDPNALIEYDAILDLFTNTAEESVDKYLTGDIARYGQNKTVLKSWKGFEIYKIVVYEKQGLDQTEIKIRDLLKQERIPYSHTIIDEVGVGGGIVDNLKGIKGFVANSSALENPLTKEKENYKTLKDQCGYMLADKINKREIAITAGLTEKDSETIIEELEQIKAKDVERDAPLQLMPKEEVIENVGHSPDFSDCMLMRMWFELKRPGQGQVRVHRPGWVRYGRRK